MKYNQLQLCSSLWKHKIPHSKSGPGRCHLDEQEQTANESNFTERMLSPTTCQQDDIKSLKYFVVGKGN